MTEEKKKSKRTIEAQNLIEEVREAVDTCVECGMCKAICPVFQELREETFSPRGRVLMLKKDVYEKILYDCTLCKSCERCAVGVKLCEALRKARKVLVEEGKETDANKEMIKNLKKSGNIFGKSE